MNPSRKLITENAGETLRILCKRIGYPYTQELYESMRVHPNFSSFLSFHYTLKRVGINNVAVRADYEQLKQDFPMPVMAHVVTNTELFLLVEKVDNEQVYILNEKNKTEPLTKKEFLEIWSGNILVVDVDHVPAYKPGLLSRTKEFFSTIRIPFAILTALCLLAFFVTANGMREWANIAYLALYASGLVFSVLLLMQQFDKHNPLVRRICTSKSNDSKRNCSSILDSKDAYFIGLFSWSDLGFLFFAVLFTLALVLPELSLTIGIISSFAAFTYVFYSLYYQKYVARSWCTLCLGVQAVLISLFALSIFSLPQFNVQLLLSWTSIMHVLLLAAAIISAYTILKPLIAAKVEQFPQSRRYKLLKHDEGVRKLLLNRQRLVDTKSISKTIALGNSEGSDVITVVFSPICPPCMEELSVLLPLIKTKSQTALELIFLLDKVKYPESEAIAVHLLNAYTGNPESFLAVLEEYVSNYPKSRYKLAEMPENSQAAQELILEYEGWCKANKLSSTPRIYLNSRRLPGTYTAIDLDYICD